jgi:hypothetical protein
MRFTCLTHVAVANALLPLLVLKLSNSQPHQQPIKVAHLKTTAPLDAPYLPPLLLLLWKPLNPTNRAMRMAHLRKTAPTGALH